MTSSAAIASLRRHAEAIRLQELARVEARLSTLTPEDRAAVDAVTGRLVEALLQEPAARLQQTSGESLVDVLCGLFALDEAA